MCMITYIPINESNFMLTHSRDESILRPIATPPIKREINGVRHMYPVDPQGKGTWIGMSEKGNVAALFNGGTKKHSHEPPYKHSRGLIIPEYFKHQSFNDFQQNFDSEGLEPFTLLVIEKGHIYEMRKDPDKLDVREIDPLKPQLFMSANLYPRSTEHDRRLELLNIYYDKGFVSQKEILNYHDVNRFEITSKNKKYDTGSHILKTVSTTSITKTPSSIGIDYLDKVNDIKITNKLPVSKEQNQEVLQ